MSDLIDKIKNVIYEEFAPCNPKVYELKMKLLTVIYNHKESEPHKENLTTLYEALVNARTDLSYSTGRHEFGIAKNSEFKDVYYKMVDAINILSDIKSDSESKS